MSVPADRSDPRKLAEKVIAWSVKHPMTAEAQLARELLAALDREAAIRENAKIIADESYRLMGAYERAEDKARAAEARAEAAEKALREIDAEATRVLWDLDGVPTEPMFDELAIKIIAAREALASAAGGEEA